jgi:hypothetical protein
MLPVFKIKMAIKVAVRALLKKLRFTKNGILPCSFDEIEHARSYDQNFLVI